jgi:uncharacterized protein (DUF58 family)
MSRRVRPARPLAPIAVAAAILAIWWLVAHNGGAGWVQALGDVVFGVLAVGIFGPALVLSLAKVRVCSAPADGTAGQPVEVVFASSTRLRVRVVELGKHETFVGPVAGRSGDDGSITLVPERRGVHRTVTLDVATSAPFALQWWTCRVSLPLPTPFYIAPRLGRPMSAPRRASEGEGESTDTSAADAGHPRGARPYRPGDGRRQVHWRATAHTGELMVREVESTMADPVTVTVELPRHPDEAERVAGRALGTVVLLLDRGLPVLLATLELAGPVVGAVGDRREAGRRLARAVPGALATGHSAGVAVGP